MRETCRTCPALLLEGEFGLCGHCARLQRVASRPAAVGCLRTPVDDNLLESATIKWADNCPRVMTVDANGNWKWKHMGPAASEAGQSEDTPPAELRPPPEHEGKLLHWIAVHDHPGAKEWPSSYNQTRDEWALIGMGERYSPRDLALRGYRYLGPAEWRPNDQLTGNLYAARRKIELQRDAALARIATLEAENASLLAALEHKRELLADAHTVAQGAMSDSWQLTAMHPDGTRRRLAYGDLGRCEAAASNPLAMKGWTLARIEPMPSEDRELPQERDAATETAEAFVRGRQELAIPLRALRGGDGRPR